MPKVSDKSKGIIRNGMGLPEDPIRTVISVNPLDPELHPDPESYHARQNGGGGGKKLGHRRIGDDGEVTYKKFETTQLIGSIQLGLQYVLTSEGNLPERDLLLPVS